MERVGRAGGRGAGKNTCKTQQTEAEIEITSASHGNIQIRCDKQRGRERERKGEVREGATSGLGRGELHTEIVAER